MCRPTRRVRNPFVDSGYASEIAVLEKKYDKGIVGDDQLEMTRFQKQVLLKEEERAQEQSQAGDPGNQNPSGVINSKGSVGGQKRVETTRYKNNNEFETENQVEFVN